MTDAKPLHIFMADDDADDRDLFAEAAAEHQHLIIQTAENGIKLMEILSKSEILPDFVLLDLNMPLKGGKECIAEIRAHDRFKNLPVIVYSTSSNKRDILETYDLGANLYLPKPNSFSALRKIVKIVMHIDWNDYQPKSQHKKFVLHPQDLDRYSI